MNTNLKYADRTRLPIFGCLSGLGPSSQKAVPRGRNSVTIGQKVPATKQRVNPDAARIRTDFLDGHSGVMC